MEQKNSKKTQEILDVLNYKTIGGTLLRLFSVGRSFDVLKKRKD
jgi:hypothetical protein